MQDTWSQPLARECMAYVLAGGRGSRLKELAADRANPAVYFGRMSRIIDSGVRIPEGLVVGEDPELGARRFRRTENGVGLINKAMIEALK